MKINGQYTVSKVYILFFIILCFAEIVKGQNSIYNGHPVFQQQTVNEMLQSASQNTESYSLPSVSKIKKQESGAFNLLKNNFGLYSPPQINLSSQKSQSVDTVIVGAMITDTLYITGTYSCTGPVYILNNGVLIFQNANATIYGDMIVFGNGKILADSSTLFFPQTYFYQRSLIAAQHGYARFNNCTFNYSGMSHNLVAVDSSVVEMNNVYNNDWTTAGTFGSPTITINGTNLAGEYILSGNAHVSFNNANTLLLWHQFPASAVINFSFPPGDTLYSYQFNNTITGINGINYNVQVDTSYNVWWGMMPVNGSDVTISNSQLRTIGAWFTNGDSVNVSGLIDNSAYTNFTAPLADRNLHLINSSVQTWSLYVFDSSYIGITSCIVGEVGCQYRARAIGQSFLLDGSGGYFWATDTSFIVASNTLVTSTVRSERNGIFVFGYGSVANGTASAIGNSIMIVVQSSLPQDPIAYDGAAAWFANIVQPSSAFVNSIVAVTGSAWIDQGPLGSWMDFGSYSLYFNIVGSSVWNALVIDSLNEIHSNNNLTLWNTTGLTAGSYQLHLILKNNLGDSVEAVKQVNLLPSALSLTNIVPENISVIVYPSPATDNIVFEIGLPNDAEVNLELYDYSLRKVETILNEKLNKGTHIVSLNSNNLSPGIYFYKITAGDFVKSGKIEIVK
jgi:hypothetical protein